MNYDEMIRAT